MQVEGHAVRAQIRQVVMAQQVSPAQLDGVHPHAPGGDVEHHFPGERFELPRPPIGRPPGRVRVHRLGGEAGSRNPVGSRKQGADERRRANRPRRRIGPAVGDEVELNGLDGAVGIERHLDLAVLVPRLAGCEKVLASILHPLDRRSHFGRRQHHAHLVALHHDLLTEAAARVTHDHPDAMLRYPQQARAEEPDLMGGLSRRVDRHLTGRARVVDHQTAPLHWDGGVSLLVYGLGDGVLGRIVGVL